MASTVGHALCGVTCLLAATATHSGQSLRAILGSVAAFILLANLPDIDFLVGYLVASDAHAFHQGATHSLLFAVGSGLLFGLLFRRSRPLWPSATIASVTILSHDIVDLVTGPSPGFNPSPGLPLLWPFESGLVSAPVTIFLGIDHESFDRLLSVHNMNAVLREVAIFLPLITLAFLIRLTIRRLNGL